MSDCQQAPAEFFFSFYLRQNYFTFQLCYSSGETRLAFGRPFLPEFESDQIQQVQRAAEVTWRLIELQPGIRRASGVLSVDSLCSRLQSSSELLPVGLRSFVRGVTPSHTRGSSWLPCFWLSFLFSDAQPLCAAFTHPINQQSPIDLISKSLLSPHHPVHPPPPLVPVMPHPSLDSHNCCLAMHGIKSTLSVVFVNEE